MGNRQGVPKQRGQRVGVYNNKRLAAVKLGCVLGFLLRKGVINGLDGGAEAGDRSKRKLLFR